MQGHFNYYAVPRNQRKLGAFKYQVYRLWLRTLRQRSQRHRMTGEPPVRAVPTAKLQLSAWASDPRFSYLASGPSSS